MNDEHFSLERDLCDLRPGHNHTSLSGNIMQSQPRQDGHVLCIQVMDIIADAPGCILTLSGLLRILM